jgi:hypothetical protein
MAIVLYALLLVAVVLVHAFVFVQLNLEYVDSDQPYMWMGANDFAKGLFYEPRYYAQNYNTFMEALFAVPFIWCGMAVYKAVPLATHLIFLFPFVFSSLYLFAKKQVTPALFFLAIILCLPADYDLLTSLPRGFVSGLFFCSFFVISFLHPQHLVALLFNSLLAVVGYFVNPNSLLVSIPFLVYFFLQHFKNPRYHAFNLLVLLFAGGCYLFFDFFYLRYPDYIVNGILLSMSPEFFLENIRDLDRRFAHVSFFKAKNCLVLLFTLLLLSVLLFKKDKKGFVAFLAFILVLLLSFFSSKTVEGSAWAYMSYSRMYLGIPLFIGLWLVLIHPRFKKQFLLLFIIPVLFSLYKITHLKPLLSWHYQSANFQGVKVIPLRGALEAITFYKKVCADHHCDFMLVSNRFWLNNFLCYGGPALDANYPTTRETKLEKRYWVRNDQKNQVVQRFIMVSSAPDIKDLLPKNENFELTKLDDYGLTLVANNRLNTELFIDFINSYEPYD